MGEYELSKPLSVGKRAVEYLSSLMTVPFVTEQARSGGPLRQREQGRPAREVLLPRSTNIYYTVHSLPTEIYSPCHLWLRSEQPG